MDAGRILVAEDDESMRTALRMFLSSKNYSVTLVEDGSKAAAELERDRYDLLITDLMMPRMTGEELLETLENKPPDDRPAIIVMTAHGSTESAVKGIKAGIGAYLRKPLDYNEFDTAVHTVMERRRLERELKEHYRELDRKVMERTRELALINDRMKVASADLEHKINQLLILNWMGNRARVSGVPGEAAMVLVSSVAQAINFDRVCLWLMHDDGTGMSLAACHGTGEAVESGDRVIDSSRFSSLPMEGGEAVVLKGSVCDFYPSGARKHSGGGDVVVAPLVVRNPENEELRCWEYKDCDREECPAKKYRAIACWTIKDSCLKCTGEAPTLLEKMENCKKCEVYRTNTRGKVTGLLCADNKATGRPVSEDDVKALNVFANSAATIMENIRLMESLIKSERFTDSIINNMNSGLLVTDLSGRIRVTSSTGAEILRHKREELIGKHLIEVLPEAGRMMSVESSPIGHEVELNTKDGPVTIGYNSSYLIGPNGNTEGIIVVFKDLCEVKRLHSELRERSHFAAIGKVAAGVAHEIRNPLFGITAVAQILGRETAADSPVKPLLDAMLQETSRLNRLVEELLLYGRPVKVSAEPVDLASLFESVLEFHMAGMEGKGIKLAKDFAAGLPPVMVDPNQMRQVFLNLLVNAIDASNEGGQVKVSARRENGHMSVKIADTGMGIPKEDLSKVFDLFFTTKEKGTGLGLAICRKIVEDHGGTVGIKSRPGKGTTVELRLPCPPASQGVQA